MTIDWNILWATALARATERSTWLGVIALLAAFGVVVQPEHVELICGVGSGLAGVILVATKDSETVEVKSTITVNAAGLRPEDLARLTKVALEGEPK
ncbi:hypothetical protein PAPPERLAPAPP_00810 [Brevundimonas phage vB_BpoS-Papperlapapp]|uniref:Uncharacterized protein n=1 Tax=Brevundimonas phage vB_BpoS-Domovoi TaxID=2948598 RepID=A0A9E7SKY6_9CAUD|nr:hypothetical protein DOMOVOI_05590 [Brevundimonas phage vB_BpoS-Domovoi]USN15823.1 hypothetical protein PAPPERLAPAPP_00810 [Brevundimonas phage vB_BpoS-Papperlapapp]